MSSNENNAIVYLDNIDRQIIEKLIKELNELNNLLGNFIMEIANRKGIASTHKLDIQSMRFIKNPEVKKE